MLNNLELCRILRSIKRSILLNNLEENRNNMEYILE
jgi:hypothetical protein